MILRDILQDRSLDAVRQVLREHSLLARKKYQLVAIACVSKSPNHAFHLARRLGWNKEDSWSTEALAQFYFLYGAEVFEEEVMELDPNFSNDLCFDPSHHEERVECRCYTFQDVCLCRCHYCRHCNRYDSNCKGSEECGCECHERCCSECESRHPEMEAPDMGEDEYVCSCFCHDCPDCSGCGGPEECGCQCHDPCYDCEDNHPDDNDASYRYYSGPPVVSHAPQSSTPSVSLQSAAPRVESVPAPRVETPEERVQRVASNLRQAGGDLAREIKVVGDIDGDEMNAAADHRQNTVLITREVVGALNDDEIAYILAHEAAHFEHKDHERLRQRLDEKSDQIGKEIDGVNEGMKAKGRGFIVRTLANIGMFVAGIASLYVDAKAQARRHEDEADQRAIDLAHKAGFDPNAAPEALAKLHGGYLPSQGFLEGITSSHPDPSIRASKLEREARRKKER